MDDFIPKSESDFNEYAELLAQKLRPYEVLILMECFLLLIQHINRKVSVVFLSVFGRKAFIT